MPRRLHLFEGFGVELEYMIVDRATLAARPVADRLLEAVAGEVVSEVECGPLAWSNELVKHVIELKTNGPAPALAPLPAQFQTEVRRIDALLEPLGARLMPTAMHPWFDPAAETRLWEHEHGRIYETYHRIFDCRGHGWSNLQSMHLNLPFADDTEFARLHAAIRAVLPLLPALAASSPIVDGVPAGAQCHRMRVYRTNSRAVPSVAGEIVPEPTDSRAAYERDVLGPIYRDLAPHDPEGVLRDEFANARGAIARFGRGAIEIRVIDVQERPRADVAIAAATVAVLRALVSDRWCDHDALASLETGALASILWATVDDSDRAVVDDGRFLACFGLEGCGPISAGEIWRALLEELEWGEGADEPWRAPLEVVLDHGTLSRRILDATGPKPSHASLFETYGRLCGCLADDAPFLP